MKHTARALVFTLGALALALASACSPSVAHAQDGGAAAEANEHFERGIALFNEGRFDAALAEFQRAYEVSPAYPVLYNVGRVWAELGRPVEAARAFESYLREGGEAIAAGRRLEVEALLSRELARIGRVGVEANVPGSIVSIDGIDVATTPLAAPIEVGAGRHTIGVRAPGYEGVTRALDVAGGVEERVAVELRPEVVPRGSLRITASVAGVRVRVDGVEVGRTPLDATVPVHAGDHDIVGVRAGYLDDARRVHVEDGAELTVHLRPEVDPAPGPADVGTLDLVLPDARLVVRVDGLERSTLAPLALPVGAHTLEVDAEDREGWRGEVEVPPGAVLTLAPPLSWTDRARHERLASAELGRTAGIVLATAGAALLLGGLALAAWNEVEIARTDARILVLGDEFAAMGCPPRTVRCDEIARELTTLAEGQGAQNALRGVSIVAAIAGAAMAGGGIVLVATAPSEASIDAAAHAELRLGLEGVVLRGAF